MGKLALIKILIEPAHSEQFLMVPLLNDVPVLHHQNHIRFPYRRQTVGHDKAGPSLHHLLKRLLYLNFRPCID